MSVSSVSGFNIEKPRVVDVFLHYLKAEGAGVVFGIPGGLLHPFFEAVEEDDDIRLILTRHEEGAAFMADGYARVGKRLAVCAGTSGPGATNMLTGVSCAFADGVPMLVVTGQAALAAMGKGAAQEATREDMDIVSMFKPVTKYSTMVSSPKNFAHHLRRALRKALTGRPGPVHLNVPVDIWEQPLTEEWFDPATYRVETRTFDRRNVQRAAEKLVKARFPVVLAGSGVDIAGAKELLITLAEILPARVATSPRAKGIFPEDHPLSLGVMGFAGHSQARETLLGKDVDVLLTVGASLNETTTHNWNPGLKPSDALIQIDIDPDRIGRNYPVDVPLEGDARTIVLELVYHLHRLIRDGSKPASQWPLSEKLERGHERFLDPEYRTAQGNPIKPQRWRTDLEEVLPDDAVIFSDIGGHMLFNLHHLCIRKEQKFVLNLGFGSMGHGTVAPIGASLAEPARPVFAIVGDGCFTMNGMEIITAREYRVSVIWIVENNNMHGITWWGSQQVGKRKPLPSVKYRQNISIAGIAEAMGVHSWVVTGPGQMQEVVPQALLMEGPSLIEVKVDSGIAPPLGDRAKSIAGFIEK